MELPELFLEYMASMTGKSPSTTGAGMEGPMTKGPFNCLGSVYDLNNAILSFILTGYHGFLSAAGYVGPKIRVGHDITYLLPEIWCRMRDHERSPRFLIDHGYLERCENFEYRGQMIQAERLGHRITEKFIRIFAGRVFQSPDTIFTDEMLRPELQDMEIFVDSVNTIVDAHRRAASLILEDPSSRDAIPPLRALLHIAAHGNYEGMTLRDGNFRKMFTRESVVDADWYRERLKRYQLSQMEHLDRGLGCIEGFAKENGGFPAGGRIDFAAREKAIAEELALVSTDDYLRGLVGTIGK
jgi:hypothetical protein